MIRNPTPYPSPQARRGENSPNLSQASRGVNVLLCASTEEGRAVRFYAVIDEETQ